MKVPDKVSYTRGEKTAEIFCGTAAALLCAAEIVMMAVGAVDGGNIIILLVMLLFYGIFSVCSVYPQHTNIFNKPQSVCEDKFHKVRSAFITGKIVVAVILFVISLPIFG